MPVANRKIDGIGVALLGSFNPQIVQPFWLAAKGLIREDEAKAAKVNVIHPEFAQFNTDWLRVQVSHDRFDAMTTDQAHWDPLRDLVLGLFKLLEHTPIASMGVNRDTHYEFEKPTEHKNILDSLVLKTKWPKSLKEPEVSRLAFVSKHSAALPSGIQGKVTLTLEPSVRVKDGLYVNINQHFADEKLDPISKPGQIIDRSRDFMTMLEENWKHFQETFNEISSQVVPSAR